MFRWSTVELTAPTPTIESTAKESVSAEKIPIEGRSVDRVAIARESKGTWITGGCRERDADYRSGKRETTFFPVFKKMTVDVRDITKMIAEEGKATSWRLRESIRVRELAATHRLGQIRRFLMLEEKKTWKREFGFNRIETAAEMDEKSFRTSPGSEPFFYRNMSNSRHPHTSDEFTIEMKVYVERLRMKIVLSQPARPQYDPLPRRAAIGTGSDQPGTLWFKTSTDKEGFVTLKISMDGFLNSNCASPEQECVLLQLDVGLDDDNKTTTQQSPRSRGVREINEEAAAARDDRVVNRAKQAV